MFKPYCLFLLLILSTLSAFSQYVSPSQLSKIHGLWLNEGPEQLENYLHQLSPYWKNDLSMIRTESNYRSVTWLFAQKDAPVALITVLTLNDGQTVTDKSAFITNSPEYYNRFIASLKAAGSTIIHYDKDDNGSITSVYKLNKVHYQVIVDPPNERGAIVYTALIQSTQ